MRHMRMMRVLLVRVTLMGRRQRTGARLRVGRVLRRTSEPQVRLLQVGIVVGAEGGVRLRVGVRRTVYHMPYFRLLVADVVRQFGLLEAGGGHPLVAGSGAGRRIRGIEARLDQGFARLAGYHRLEFSRRESVHVACFRSDQEHHLCSCQR